MADNVLQYYLRTTEKRFDELREDLKEIKECIDELQEFKMENIASARLTSLIVSGICGFITMVATVAIAYYSRPVH